MKQTINISAMLAGSLILLAPNSGFTLSENDLRGPINSRNAAPVVPDPSVTVAPAKPSAIAPGASNIGGLSAPGADALMTPDMLLVIPSDGKQQAPTALKDLTGSALKMQIEQSDVVFEKLHGVMITVTNGTNRPLVIDGDKATAIIGNKSSNAVTIATIQHMIIAPHKTSQDFEMLLTKALPAAVTVGAAPTIRDIKEGQRPVLERYGPDELRRKVEFSRFGRRILWTNQKVRGILYFQSDDDLKNAKIEIPATTLFDNKDTSILTASPAQ